jgi:hypothetical protein
MLVATTLPESLAFGSIGATSKNVLVAKHESATRAFGYDSATYGGEVHFTPWNYQPLHYDAQTRRRGQGGYHGHTAYRDDRCCDDVTLLYCYMCCCTDYSNSYGRHDYYYVDNTSGLIAWYASPAALPCCDAGTACNADPCGVPDVMSRGMSFENLGLDATPPVGCCNSIDVMGMCFQNEMQLDSCFGDCGDCVSNCCSAQLACAGGAFEFRSCAPARTPPMRRSVLSSL